MTITATINITGNITGKPLGSEAINSTMTGNVYGVVAVTLASGANTITVPITGTSGCIIKLDGSNTALVTLKGVTGDTGVPIGKTGTHVLNWGSGNAPTDFCLNSAALQAVQTYIEFF